MTNDRDICAALDGLTSSQRHALARSAAEARDDRAAAGEHALAAVWSALAVLAAEAEDVWRGRLAELERAAAWTTDDG